MSLEVRFDEQIIGIVTSKDGGLAFEYLPGWSDFDLSFAMPKQNDSYHGKIVRSFFENILTEGNMRLQVAQNNHIDADDVYNFLKEFGKDCAGALTISEMRTPNKTWKKKQITLDELNQKIEERRSLYVDYEGEEGVNFSLPGVQDKLPVIWEQNNLYLGLDGHPSTHILKPQIIFSVYKQTVLNEYTCMKLAANCGLIVADVDLIEHKKNQYYLIKRYDRDGFKRLHQQDFCQALGLLSHEKYEVRGGPSFIDIYNCIKEFSENKTKDLFYILDWFCFNLLIGNHDTHAKNLSFLYKNGKWQLAPFYDLMSTAVYKGTSKNFAFSVGGQFDPIKLRQKNFTILEEQLGLRKGVLLKRLQSMINLIEKNLPSKDEFIIRKIRELIIKRMNLFKRKVLRDLKK